MINVCNNNTNSNKNVTFLRYPGGKQRKLMYFSHMLPSPDQEFKTYIEPFLGGGSVFFHVNPESAVLSDKNPELINLYYGIRDCPNKIWNIYRKFPDTKEGYYEIRRTNPEDLDLPTKAARTLYLNRTCFKGMWRHNAKGDFNVGYGGQDRRWVISKENLKGVSERLQMAQLKCCDFEETLNKCEDGDFIFLDPPYRPGEQEQLHAHYIFGRFKYEDQKRLARILKKITKKDVCWVMTNSAHPDILRLYSKFTIQPLAKSGTSIGKALLPGEVVINNFTEALT